MNGLFWLKVLFWLAVVIGGVVLAAIAKAQRDSKRRL